MSGYELAFWLLLAYLFGLGVGRSYAPQKKQERDPNEDRWDKAGSA